MKQHEHVWFMDANDCFHQDFLCATLIDSKTEADLSIFQLDCSFENVLIKLRAENETRIAAWQRQFMRLASTSLLQRKLIEKIINLRANMLSARSIAVVTNRAGLVQELLSQADRWIQLVQSLNSFASLCVRLIVLQTKLSQQLVQRSQFHNELLLLKESADMVTVEVIQLNEEIVRTKTLLTNKIDQVMDSVVEENCDNDNNSFIKH